jgi:penicillin-binding protein 1A
MVHSSKKTPVKQIVVVGSVLISLCFAIYLKLWIIDELPSLEQLEKPPQELATRILDSDGNLIDNFFIKRRMFVPYDSVSHYFFDALIATEDREFYNHWGVHTARIFKATVKNIFAGRAKEGASTLTQQLARNLYFTQEQTIHRKLREAFTAVQIERTYTKREILELYANTVNFGRGAYGIQVASQVFFGKSPKDLTLAECAYFVGLLKAPASYDARDHYDRAIRRRNLVLTLMRDAAFIDESTLEKASDVAIPITESRSLLGTCDAPHFLEMIRKKLSRDERLRGYDLYRDGLTIYTTLDSRVQRSANAAVEEQLREFQAEFDRSWTWRGKQDLLNAMVERSAKETAQYIAAKTDAERRAVISKCTGSTRFVDSIKHAVTTIQCGVTVMDPSTGAVLAMVGASPRSMQGVQGARYSLNHCTEVRRQPGSAFKPFVYASALADSPLTPASDIESGPFSYTLPDGKVWSPRGSMEHGGPVSLSTALKFSVNTVAARLITEHTNPTNVIALARRMGITTPMDAFPALALGVEEVYPIELTASYGAFANNGISVQPVSILRVEDRFGKVIYENSVPSGLSDAMQPRVCKQMVTMMRGVVDGGTASTVRKFFRYDAAGKTGTTNSYADAWFVGYTPQLVAGVWLGFDDHRIKFTGTYGMGGKAAAPLWGRMMGKIYDDPYGHYKQRSFPERDTSIRTLEPTEVGDAVQEDALPGEAATRPPAQSPPAPASSAPKQTAAPAPKPLIRFPKLR